LDAWLGVWETRKTKSFGRKLLKKQFPKTRRWKDNIKKDLREIRRIGVKTGWGSQPVAGYITATLALFLKLQLKFKTCLVLESCTNPKIASEEGNMLHIDQLQFTCHHMEG
jgi:hypothetical protein